MNPEVGEGGVGPEGHREGETPLDSSNLETSSEAGFLPPSAKIPFEERERLFSQLKEKLTVEYTKRWNSFLDEPENIKALQSALLETARPIIALVRQAQFLDLPDFELKQQQAKIHKIIPKILTGADLVAEMLAYSPTIRKHVATFLAKREFSDSFALTANFAGLKVKLREAGVGEDILERINKTEERLDEVVRKKNQLLSYRFQIGMELGMDMAAREETKNSYIKMLHPTKADYLAHLDREAQAYYVAAIHAVSAETTSMVKPEEKMQAQVAAVVINTLLSSCAPGGPIRQFLRKFDEREAARIYGEK